MQGFMHCNHSRLKLAVLRIARERYHVADVLHTGDEEHQTLETETETAVRNRAVFTRSEERRVGKEC